MPYLDELLAFYPEKIEIVTSEQGRINISNVLDRSNLDNSQTYGCGPSSMMSDIEQYMTSKGNFDYHIEYFKPKIFSTKPELKEFTVYCAKSQAEITVPEDESILVAADFAGIEVEGDCLEGTCGACVTNIIKGEVIHMDSVLTAAERDAGEKMMICVSRAIGDRIVLDL